MVDQRLATQLWAYILEKGLTKTSERKVALLATPSKLCKKIDCKDLIENHRRLEDRLGCSFHVLDEDRFAKGKYDGGFNILCITCGDTAGARQFWQGTQCENVIRQWYQEGVLCTGYSAGFILFHDWASTDSQPGPPGCIYGIMRGMGVTKGGAIPHADTQPQRIPDFQLALKTDTINPVLALGEDVMAIYKNEALQRFVSPLSKPTALLVGQDHIKALDVERI